MKEIKKKKRKDDSLSSNMEGAVDDSYMKTRITRIPFHCLSHCLNKQSKTKTNEETI